MSEPTARQFAQAAADLCGHEPSQPDGACVDCTGKAIAAAEERGRRRGIEEWDELRDRMHQTIAFLLSVIASGEKLSDEEEAGIRAMLREGLAPRDSGEKP